jgi:hypothetical protein
MHQDDQDEDQDGTPLSDDNDDLDLESLSNHDHPCLARGRFSVFNSSDVMHVFRNRDINYKLDMDGVVGISR